VKRVVVEMLNDFLRIAGDGASVVGGVGLCALVFGTDTESARFDDVDVDVDVDVDGKRN
jgi:hypothetical protein